MIQFLKESQKALVAGAVAGLTTFQGGATIQIAVVAGVAAALLVFGVPNAKPVVPPAP